MSKRPEYLGDAVYATFDRGLIELRLNAHTEDPVVYLEREVFAALVDYARRNAGWLG